MILNIQERTWLPSVLSATLLLLTPFIIFIKYQGYSILRPETFFCFALLAVIGAALGLFMELLGQYTRVVVFSFLVTLQADIQLQQTDRSLILWITFAVSLIVFWFLRKHLARMGMFIVVILFLSTIFIPTGSLDSNQLVTRQFVPGNPNLPIFLHVILDENISVEGIPEQFDPDGYHAEALRDFYLDRGFQVFGRAYSRYYNTWHTMPNLVNFHDTENYTRYCGGVSRKFFLKRNQYFELMSKRGYQIHVYQSDYLDYCPDNIEGNVASCYTYELEAIKSIENSPISTGSKFRMIMGMYSRLSSILSPLHLLEGRVSPVTSMALLNRLETDLNQASPGMMFLVHLMLPHSPYAFEPDCQFRENPEQWLFASNRNLKKKNNTPASRAERYPLYLEPIECTNLKLDKLFGSLQATGKFNNMIILIHGDHGSRIILGKPTLKSGKNPLTKSDVVDGFSTLFAVKWPGRPAEYDRRILPIGPLFAALMTTGEVPPGLDWAGGQFFFLKGLPKMQKRAMPDFGRALNPYQSD